jgi:hypothetical protein
MIKYPAFSLAVLILASCRDRDAVDDYITLNREFEKGYRSTNLSVIENSLLTHQARLLQLQHEGAKGINFDHTLALVNARLSYFYYNRQQTNEAAKYFGIATNYLKVRERKEGKPGTVFMPQDLYKMVEYADKHIPDSVKDAR